MIFTKEILKNLVLIISWSYSFAHNFHNFVSDISENCRDNQIISIHLPYFVEAADSRLILLRSISSFYRECSLLVSSPEFQSSCRRNCIFLFVLEVYRSEAENFNTSLIKPGGIILNLVGKNQRLDVSADISEQLVKQDYILTSYVLESREFEVYIDFTNFSGTIKMTLTAAKKLEHYENCSLDEIYCTLGGHMLCISKQLECDGNLNCGTPKMFDEYCHNLSFENDLVLTLIYGTLLVAFILFLIFQILKSCIPKVGEHFFVYNEEQDYTFVLTTQSLPPVEDQQESDFEKPKKPRKPTDNHFY